MKAPVNKFVFKPSARPKANQSNGSGETTAPTEPAPTQTAPTQTAPAQAASTQAAPAVAQPTLPLRDDTEPMTLPVPPPPTFKSTSKPGASAAKRLSVPRVTNPNKITPRAPTPAMGTPKVPLRPSAAKPPRPPSNDADSQALGDEVDALFDGAKVSGDAKAGPGRLASTADTERELRRLFGEIAAHHTAQLRDFYVELSMSPTGKQWTDICAPALSSIRRAAEGIAHAPLSSALSVLERALDDARRGGAPLVDGSTRTTLLESFAALTKILPEAFDIAKHRARRDPIIVHTLLEQVAGLSTLAKDRIHGAGLSSLDAFYGTRPSDLSATTGVRETLCAKVIERFEEYRRSRAERAEHAEHDAERKRLSELLSQLKDRQVQFREAELAERTRDKRRLRDERSELVRNINLALAHLGQVRLIEEISRIPIDAKVERIGKYLRQPAKST